MTTNLTPLYPRYETFAGLGYHQRRGLSDSVGTKAPLIYGRDVFQDKPPILSHRISVIAGLLRHQSIAVVGAGVVGGVDSSLYSGGIKLVNGSVVEWRPGSPGDNPYAAHPTVSYSYPVSGSSITIPTSITDGTPVVSGSAFYRDSTGTWIQVNGTPGQTLTTPSPASWVTLNTATPTTTPGVSTALTQLVTRDSVFVHPDLYIRDGRQVKRLVAAGRGPYVPSADHVIPTTTSYLLNVQDGKIYSLPMTNPPVLDYDGDWVVFRNGSGDRFADVTYDLLTNVIAGNRSTPNVEALVDHGSFVAANSHTDSLSLKFSGAVDTDISILDFITDYACMFDLMSARDRNRLRLLPHTVQKANVSAIFNYFNSSDVRLNYHPLDRHDFSGVIAATQDSFVPVSYIGSGRYSTSGMLLLNGRMVARNNASFKTQLGRIHGSATRQTRSIEIFAPLVIESLQAGDFVVADSDYFTDDRTHTGGIVQTKLEGVYTLSLEDPYLSFVAKTGIAANTVVVDFDNRRDSNGRVPVVVGDLMSIALSGDTVIYAVVISVDVTAVDYVIKVDQISWVDSLSSWSRNGASIVVPKDSVITIYKIGGHSGVAFVYNTSGIPVLVNLELSATPQNGRFGRLGLTAKILTDADVAASSPVIFLSDRQTLWRVSSVEPLNHGLAVRPDRDMSQELRPVQNDGCRIVATEYPFVAPTSFGGAPPKVFSETFTPIANPAPVNAEVLNYLGEIATGNEFANVEQKTRIWREGPITIAVKGTPSSADSTYVQKVIDELQVLTNKTISIVPGPASDVSVYFGPETTFSAQDPDYVAENLGFFSAGPNIAGTDITSGKVLIDTSRTNQLERNHLIREELTQLLVGLPDDSTKYPDSIFYQPWTTTQEYSDMDRELIRLMSGPGVTSGLNSAQLKLVV